MKQIVWIFMICLCSVFYAAQPPLRTTELPAKIESIYPPDFRNPLHARYGWYQEEKNLARIVARQG